MNFSQENFTVVNCAIVYTAYSLNYAISIVIPVESKHLTYMNTLLKYSLIIAV